MRMINNAYREKAEQAGRRTKALPGNFFASEGRGNLPGSEKGCRRICT